MVQDNDERREERRRPAAACTDPAGARTWSAGASRGARLAAASAVPSGSPDYVWRRTAAPAAGAVHPAAGRKGRRIPEQGTSAA